MGSRRGRSWWKRCGVCPTRSRSRHHPRCDGKGGNGAGILPCAAAAGPVPDFPLQDASGAVAVTNQALIGKMTAADYDLYRSNTVAMWRNLVGNACRISVPEARVEQAHRASAVHVLLATRTHNAKNTKPTVCRIRLLPTTFFDYVQMYDSLQRPEYIEPTVQYWLRHQGPNGRCPWEGPSAYHGRVLLGLASHVLFKGDTHYAATVYRTSNGR